MRIRPGTDIALIWGMLCHIFKNGWEDKEYINDRVYGMDEVREEVEEVDARQGRGGHRRARRRRCAASPRRWPQNRPGTSSGAWADAAHHRQRQRARLCILQLALGNVGVSGGGANIFRGHDNVQGATDVGPNPDHAARLLRPRRGRVEALVAAVWGVDLRLDARRASPAKKLMEKPGMTVSRWIDGVLEKKEQHRPARHLRAWSSGAMRPTRRRAARDEEGHGEARPAGRHRSVSRPGHGAMLR